MSEPSIYLDADGNYRDDTPENREAYPAAEDTGTVEESGSVVPPVSTDSDAPAKATTRKSDD